MRVDLTVATNSLAWSLAVATDGADSASRPYILHMILARLVKLRQPLHRAQRLLLFEELDGFFVGFRSFTGLQALDFDLADVDELALLSLLF